MCSSKLRWLVGVMLLAAPWAPPAATPPDRVYAPTPETAQEPDWALVNYGPAPELTNTVWLNTVRPLRLAELRGQVVLIDMWTFGLINCRNVLPSLRGWHQTYAEQGLVIIGNHYPEFGFERDLDNLRAAVLELEVPYPVAQDNEGATWRAYRTRYWPTLYLIDKRGDLRYTHIGEGAYDATEAAIRSLLSEADP